MAWHNGITAVATAMSLVAVPIVVAVVGSHYSQAIKERETSAKFVELAVRILSEEPNEKDKSIRTWATRILDEHSGIKFEEDARDDIINNVPLPQISVAPLAGGFRDVEGQRTIDRVIISDTQVENRDAVKRALEMIHVSYHYLIGSDGTIESLVDENDIAFHTARNNENSIGIGLAHVSGKPYADLQLTSLTELLASIVERRKLSRDSIVAKSEVDPRKNSDFPSVRDRVLAPVFADQ